MVIASETKSNMKLKVAPVKEMTGDKTMKARAMRRDFPEFKITHKVILMTQNLPVVDEVTDAIRDRLRLIEWAYRVKASEHDTSLLEKLQKEWPYIFAWVVRGCLNWQKDRGLKPTGDIMPCELLKEWKSEVTSVILFSNSFLYTNQGKTHQN